MSNTREYKGDPIDASWSTAPWNRDGETVEASDDNTEEHSMDTIEWPENATPKEELKDDQIAVIKKAARYRNIESGPKLTQLAVGDARSPSYAGSVLRTHWPERYWVAPEDTTDKEYLEALGKTDLSGENAGNVKLSKEDVKEIRIRARTGDSLTEIADTFPVSRSCVSEAATGTNWSHLESPPPVEYDEKHKEYVPKGTAEIPRHGVGNTIQQVSTQEIRERALEGETAAEIAKDTPASKTTIRARLKGRRDVGAPDIPPLEYKNNTEGWVVADEDKTEQATIDDADTDKTEDADQPEHTGYESLATDEPDTPTAKIAAVALLAAYVIYRAVRRVV